MTRPVPTAFASLPLDPAQLANLDTLGLTAMTPVQAASLARSLGGEDLIVQAPTGSGKTVAFALPLLARLQLDSATSPAPTQALVLCPTRELADQVASEIRRLARAADNVKTLTLCGGVPLRNQQASLAHGAHVVVGTPGRIIDHLERGTLNLGTLRTLVLDEADRMLDMGFQEAIGTIARRCPGTRQTLLFSATYPEGVAGVAKQFMRQPGTVQIQADSAPPRIEQRFYEIREDQRLHAVAQLLMHFRPARTLAFCNTRQQCRDLTDVLNAQGFEALALHGELEQRDRDQVLVQFANRSCSVLVATDVAARGLDIAELEAIVNVDMASDPHAHLHRIGRTGRADASGLALSLASLDEMGSVGRVEQLLGAEVTWHSIDELGVAPGGPLVPPMATLQIVGGRKDKIRAGDVLGALTGEGGLDATRIGKINVNEFSTYVAVDRAIAEQALAALNHGRVKGRKVKVRRVRETGPGKTSRAG